MASSDSVNGCCGALFSFLFDLGFGIAAIVIGGLNINNCPVEEIIPIGLIVTGSLIIFVAFFGAMDKCAEVAQAHASCEDDTIIRTNPEDPCKVKIESGEKRGNGCARGLARIGKFVRFVWIIAFAVFTYRNFKPDYDDKSSEQYCDQTTYLYAFIMITIYLILYSLAILLPCCFCCCGCCCFCCYRAFKQHKKNKTPDLPHRRADLYSVMESKIAPHLKKEGLIGDDDVRAMKSAWEGDEFFQTFGKHFAKHYAEKRMKNKINDQMEIKEDIRPATQKEIIEEEEVGK